MKCSLRTLPVVTTALVATLAFGRVAPQQGGNEPPLRFTLEVGDEEVSILAGRSFELTIDGDTRAAILRLRPTRVFRLPELEFEYLNYMAFEADLESDTVDIWTLDGNACVVTLMRYDEGTDAEDLRTRVIDSTLEMVSNGEADPEEVEIELDGEMWPGELVTVTIGEVSMDYFFYSHAMSTGTYLLTVLDSLTDDDERTEETAESLRLLESTFRIRD